MGFKDRYLKCRILVHFEGHELGSGERCVVLVRAECLDQYTTRGLSELWLNVLVQRFPEGLGGCATTSVKRRSNTLRRPGTLRHFVSRLCLKRRVKDWGVGLREDREAVIGRPIFPKRSPRSFHWTSLFPKTVTKLRRRWGSNPSGNCSQERLTRGKVSSTIRREAHPSGCARCGAGAGCSAIHENLSAL